MLTPSQLFPFYPDLENKDLQVKAISEVCEICASETLKLNCKIICYNCGFIRDCSDP